MYYLTDIDTDGKVNNIINLPSEEYIGFLGWDRAEKEQTGVFIDNLPNNPNNCGELHADIKTQKVWYIKMPPPAPQTTLDDVITALADLDAQREADKLENQIAIAELAETILNGGVNNG